MDTSSAAPVVSTPRRTFDPSKHHKFIEMIQHITSPLSVALFSFTLSKYNLRNAMRTVVKARTVLVKNWWRSHSPFSRSASARAAAPKRTNFSAVPTSATSLAATALDGESAYLSAARARIESLYEPDAVNEVLAHVIEWPPVQGFESYLIGMNELTGLPWWASICASTVLLRVVVLPINIVLLKHQLLTKINRSKLAHLGEELGATDCSEQRVATAREIVSLPCRPLAVWWMPVIAPFFLSYFAAVHNLALCEPGLATGGMAWFVDLSQPDVTFALPVAAGLSWLAVVESGAGELYFQSNQLQLWTRMTSLAWVPIMSSMPTAVFMFWVSSNVFEVVRVRVMTIDSVRIALGIPLSKDMPAYVVPRTITGRREPKPSVEEEEIQELSR